MTPRGRFAPSPTGPLHLGNARTALLSWLRARSQGGSYLMRIEDLDLARVRPGVEAETLMELSWLGLDWDEGPDLPAGGGPYGPYRQSERTTLYNGALESLRLADQVYPCFCSRSEILRASLAPHGPQDEGPRYPGTCRLLSRSEVLLRSAQRAPAWRFRVPEGKVAFLDEVHGPQEVDVEKETGDFVVMRADGIAAYQLAVVVDDAAMAVTEVVRGDDLLSSTARQLLLYQALKKTAPRFAHVPLLVGEDAPRLAKRHGALSLGELREAGCDPRRVLGLLAATAGITQKGARVTPSDLLNGYEEARIMKTPAVLLGSDVSALLA